MSYKIINSKAERRQSEIITLLNSQGSVSTNNLAVYFKVSKLTIRRDLNFLAERNEVRRHHGGALPIKKYIANESNYNLYKNNINSKHLKPKLKMFNTIIPNLASDSRIYIDTPEVLNKLIAYLPKGEFTIFTDDVSIYNKIKRRKNITIFYLGSYNDSNCDYKYDTSKFIQNIDVSIIKADYIDSKGFMLTNNIHKANIKKAAITHSKDVLLVYNYRSQDSNSIFKVSKIKSSQCEIIEDESYY